MKAIKAGVTRNPQFGQGNGLAGTLRISTMTGGEFLIASGRGSLRVDDKGSKPIWVASNEAMQGTVVSAVLAPHQEFSMAQAFDFAPSRGEVFDIIDAGYTAEDDSLIVKLSNAAPDQPLILDWSGIPVISSSFADEAVGKLFVELGPTVFSSRVRNTKMEPLVRNLIDRAIIQRVTQTSQHGT